MSGIVGRSFREFALTVVVAIVASTVVALTLTPMMCGRVLKPKGEKKTTVEKFTDLFVGSVKNGYSKILKWVLEHKAVSLTGWAACLLGTLWLFSILPKTFLPDGDSGAITGQLMVPLGTSTEQVRKFQNEINAVLQQEPNVDRIFSATGLYPGADQSTGPVFAILKEGRRSGIQNVVVDLRRKLSMLPMGFVFLKPIPSLNLSAGGESTATGSKYSFLMNGSSREKVYKAALELEKAMRSDGDFTDVQNSVKLNMPQLNLEIFRDRASTFGVTAGDIEYALCLGFAGGKVTTFKTDTDQYDVIVELDKRYSRDPDNMKKLYVRSDRTNELVPLGSVAGWTMGVGPQNVPHFDQLNSATVSFNVKDDVPLSNATKKLWQMVKNILPADVIGNFQGQAQEFEEAVKSLGVLLLIAVLIMYITLGILYESYAHPFTILTTLPVAAFGGLATLFLFRSELSLYAYIGMFMLLGIVSKNGIMMVDFANQNLQEGATNFDAIYKACLVRFRPIIMTGASTIMGAMPIALGYGADGASRRPLGLIIVGGLIFAQVITLFVTPALFLYMQNFQEKFLDKFELLRSGAKRKREETNI
jgi:HAE1 family hydrophobic/amphiphilic exporter-1